MFKLLYCTNSWGYRDEIAKEYFRTIEELDSFVKDERSCKSVKKIIKLD